MSIPEHSPPGAMPFDSPAYGDALDTAKLALQRSVEEFERKTGRTVDSIHIAHFDMTGLQDSEPRIAREFCLSVLYTEEEEARDEALNEAWRRHLAGEGPRP